MNKKHRKARHKKSSIVNPLKYSLIICAVYMIASFVYVILSGRIAANLSESIQHLRYIERYKEILFLVVTTFILFAMTYYLFRQIDKRNEKMKEYRKYIIDAERQAAAGLLASSIAHDVKNVLMTVEFATERLDEKIDDSFDDIFRELKEANDRLCNLAEQLSQADKDNMYYTEETFDIISVVKNTIKLAGFHKKVKSCDIDLEAPEELEYTGDPSQIHQMIFNLLINSAEAIEDKGRIELNILDQKSKIKLEIKDNGKGIPEKQKDEVMKTFMTTKEEGSGLGLFSVNYCAKSHGGYVDLKNSNLGGAQFDIYLPKSFSGEKYNTGHKSPA